MGRILTDTRGLINQPKDPYWDAPITRREIQMAVNDLALNDNELTNRTDTLSIVLNFILEDILHIKDRTRLDAYVERKKKELAEKIAAAQPAQPEQQAQTQTAQPTQETQEAENGPNS